MSSWTLGERTCADALCDAERDALDAGRAHLRGQLGPKRLWRNISQRDALCIGEEEEDEEEEEGVSNSELVISK